MRLPSVPTLSVVEHLNTTYFDRVWNASDDHGAANFQLYKVTQRLQRGMVPVNLSVVGLPTTDKVYAVYRIARHTLGRFVNLPKDTWIKDTDLLKAQHVTLTTYTTNGRMIPTGRVHLRYDVALGIVLIAVSSEYTTKCTAQVYPDLYMSVYHDTTRLTPVVNAVYTISNALVNPVTVQSVQAALTTALITYPYSTLVYVNGWLYDPNYVPTLVVGDVVQIMSDPDIIGYCDLTVDDNITGYYSKLYQEYREILHIPKILNPNNVIITNDTILVGIFDTATNRGVFGHRVDPHALESITHNDFSMSRSVLQAFENGLQAKNIKVRLYVRLPTAPIHLGGEVSRLEDLYTLSDDEIKKQLAGLSDHSLPEWAASSLEQSPYLNLLYQFNGFTGSDVLTQYSAAMGYYDVCAKLSEAVHYYTYHGGEFLIQKPARLFGYPCQVIAYADGRKIPNSVLGVADYSGKFISLGFKSNSYVSPGSRIAVYITEGGPRTPKPWNPTLNTPSIVLDSDDYTLVKIVSYQTPQPIWGGNTNQGYHVLPVSPGDYQISLNSDSTVTYTASSIHFGDNFYLVPNPGMTTATYALDTMLANKQSLIFPLLTTDINQNTLPQLGQLALEVYINGYRLVEGVDYTCNPIMGVNNDVLQTLLEVSSTDYLVFGSPGNILEVVCHSDLAVSVDKGYVINNLMHRAKPPMIWNKSCSRAFAQGLLIENVEETGNILKSNQSIAEGSPYLLEWSLPYSVTKLMALISPNPESDLRTRIFNVLNLVPFTYPDTVVLSHLHALYSPFLAAVITDVANGAFTIINEPKDDLFLKQFAPYALILARDPVLGTSNPLIDRRFVTLAAHYANFTVQDPQQMMSVQRLIALVLTPSQLSIREVLI